MYTASRSPPQHDRGGAQTYVVSDGPAPPATVFPFADNEGDMHERLQQYHRDMITTAQQLYHLQGQQGAPFATADAMHPEQEERTLSSQTQYIVIEDRQVHTPDGAALSRNGSAARTNAIAKLKRAASQREMRTKSPGPNLDGNPIMREGITPTLTTITSSSISPNPLSAAAEFYTANGDESPRPGHNPFEDATSSHLLRGPSPFASSNETMNTLTVSNIPSRREGGNRSPLPSLEQLRARILQERETAGLARSASTSAASKAARQYAMEKLLGASVREGASSPVSDTAEDQEEEDKRLSGAKAERVMLRRSRTIGGLSAAAEAQRKAAFVEALDQGVPDSLRSLRRNSRRFVQGLAGRENRRPDDSTMPISPSPSSSNIDAPQGQNATSQRQAVRTEMLRKLSTRRAGGAQSPAMLLQDTAAASAATAAPTTTAAETTGAFGHEPHLHRSNQLDLEDTPYAPVIDSALNSSKSPDYHVHHDYSKTSLSPPITPQAMTVPLHPITPSPNMQSRLLTVPLGSIARSPSSHSSATGVHEDERNRASALARLYGEEAFEYERLLEQGYSTDDAYERVASARSVSRVDQFSAVASPRSVQNEFDDSLAQQSLPSNHIATDKEEDSDVARPTLDTHLPAGANVPVNVSPKHASNPNSNQVGQEEWTSKHPSEASIPLGLDRSLFIDEEDDRRLSNQAEAGLVGEGNSVSRTDSHSSVRGTADRLPTTTRYPESVAAPSSTSISSSVNNPDGEAKVARPTLTVLPVNHQGGSPLERIEDLLTPGFLADVGNPLDYSHSPTAIDRPESDVESAEDLVDGDLEGAKDDYLQHVDRMAKNMERFARKAGQPKETEDPSSLGAQVSSRTSIPDQSREGVGETDLRSDAILPNQEVEEADKSPVRPAIVVAEEQSHLNGKADTVPNGSHNGESNDMRRQAQSEREFSTTAPSAWKGATDEASPYSSNEKLTPFPGLFQTQQTDAGLQATPKSVKRKPSPYASPALEAEAAQKSENSSPAAEKDRNGQAVTDASPKETFFSTLRRKASRKGSNNSPPGVQVESQLGRSESPTAKKLASFLSRKPSTKGLNGAASPPATSPSHSKRQSPITPAGPVEKSPEKGPATTESQPTMAAKPIGVQRLASESLHTRNASTSSTASAQQVDDTSLALDSGHAHQTTLLATPAALGPATAAVLSRYSSVLTSPNQSAKFPEIPGLNARQMSDPPRQFFTAAPVLQVVTSSTVKDRFLFLFSDLIVLAKPVRNPAEKDGDATSLPTLAWTFSVKSVLSLDDIKLTMPKGERRHNIAHTSLMSTFEREFEANPHQALANVIKQSGLPDDPTTRAKLLHQTPDLDRERMSEYLFDRANAQVMRAFVYQEKFTGVSIESALRSLLLELRFPNRREPLQEMLVAFGQQWTETNRGLIKDTFSARLAVELIIAIMSLNDALHTDKVATPGYFHRPKPNISNEEFIEMFRVHDSQLVLSDRTLLRIYNSVCTDAIQQAELPKDGQDRLSSTVRVLAPGVPTRIVYGKASEPIRIAIPRVDPNFAIRLYGQDLTFQPQVLTFDKSHVQEFRIMSKSLGPHTIVFVRAGKNARQYRTPTRDIVEDFPLPRSINISVQRAFMQHCFTLTVSGKRRFMISVEDEAKRKIWLRAIKERLEKRQRLLSSGDAEMIASQSGSAYALALHVLKDTLIVPDAQQKVNSALQRSASTASPSGTITQPKSVHPAATLGRAPSDSRAMLHPLHGIGAAAMGKSTSPAAATMSQAAQAGIMNRQESISRHYYGAKGMGHSERDLMMNNTPINLPPMPPQRAPLPASMLASKAILQGTGSDVDGRGQRAKADLLTGEELILTVKQNSLLTLVIAHAQQQQQQTQAQPRQHRYNNSLANIPLLPRSPPTHVKDLVPSGAMHNSSNML